MGMEEDFYRYLNLSATYTTDTSGPPRMHGLAFSVRVTVLYVLMYVPLWLCIVVGNLMVIFAFVYNRELRRVQNYLLVSLAVTDLLTGILAIPPSLIVRLTVNPLVCSASTRINFFMPSLTFCSSSVYHLIFIAIDRCLSLVFPLRYPRLVTSRRMIRFIVVLWVCNFALACCPLYIPSPGEDRWLCHANENYNNELDIIYIIMACFLPIFFAFMMALYAVMLCVAFKHIQTRKKMSSQINLRNGARARMRGIVTMAIVVGVFGLCWLPSSYKFFYETYASTNREMLITVQTITEYFSFTNSMANPLIYGYFNRQFKIGFKIVLGKIRKLFCCDRKDETGGSYGTRSSGRETAISLSVSTATAYRAQ